MTSTNDSRRLLSNSSILFAGTILGSFFSYLFNTLMGRFLGPASYGELTAILSIVTIISVVGGGFLTVTMRYANELFHREQFKALEKLFRTFTKVIFVASIVIFLIGTALSHSLAAFFNISQPIAVTIGFLSLVFSLTIVVNRGVLQGVQYFLPLSITNALEMGLRLLFGIVFVKIGFSLNGAVGAITLATAITYFATLLQLRPLWRRAKEDTGKQEVPFNRQEIIRYTIPALLATLLLTILLNSDIIVVKYYFSAQDAGVYAAISTIAKIILYISTPIISVMFPMISEKKTKGEKHYKTFLVALSLTMLSSLVVLAIYSVAPGTIIRVLYGAAFTSLYALLPLVGLYIVIYSMINLIVNYFLAVQDFFFIWLFAAVLVLLFVAIGLYHPNIEAVVRIFVSMTSLLFAILMVRYLYTKKAQLMAWRSGDYGKEA